MQVINVRPYTDFEVGEVGVSVRGRYPGRIVLEWRRGLPSVMVATIRGRKRSGRCRERGCGARGARQFEAKAGSARRDGTMKSLKPPVNVMAVALMGVCLCALLGIISGPTLLEASAPVHGVSRRNAVVEVVEATAPAVVSITAEQRVQSAPFVSPYSFLQDFFKDMVPPQRLERASIGSGVVIDKEGHILTNDHVISGATRVTATLNDDREVECEVIGTDPDNDLAVLKAKEPLNVDPAPLGTSSDLMIGETVIAIGNPYGLSHTVTTGVVSAVHRSFKAEDQIYRDFVQIDAAINPGNSGGPLLNILGEVIGINTAIYGGAEGLGFAIPIDKAKRVVADLIQFGTRIPGWLGMEVEETYVYSGGRRHYAVVVTWLQDGGPAARAGVRVGDRLLALDRTKVASIDVYESAVQQLAVGDVMELTVSRRDVKEPLVFRVKSVEFPPDLVRHVISERLGIEVVAVTPVLAQRYKLATNEGLLITEVRQRGAVARIGGKPGDVIRKVNGVVTRTPEDLQTAIVRGWARKSLVCLIQRGNVIYTVPVGL